MDELLQLCMAGEQDAISRLVTRYRGRALDLAGALLQDEQLAEDAVQEAFLVALARLGDLRTPEAFAGWFHQIVRTCCNRLRRRRTERPRNPDGGAAPSGLVLVDENGLPMDSGISDEGASPVEQIQKRERREQVLRALAALPPASRETAALFYFEERSCLEIAGVLELPLGTVKRRLHDARLQLKSQLLGQIPEIEPAAWPETAGLPF